MSEENKTMDPNDHLAIIAKFGKEGRLEMEEHLPNDITLYDLQIIESCIRTAIMKYPIEMRNKEEEKQKNVI